MLLFSLLVVVIFHFSLPRRRHPADAGARARPALGRLRLRRAARARTARSRSSSRTMRSAGLALRRSTAAGSFSARRRELADPRRRAARDRLRLRAGLRARLAPASPCRSRGGRRSARSAVQRRDAVRGGRRAHALSRGDVPLLLLPLLVPVLLGAVRATAGLLESGALPWAPVQLLLVTDAIYLIVSFLCLRLRARRVNPMPTPAPARPGSAAACARAASCSRCSRPLWLVLVARAPLDAVQGVIQKILYVHVPCAFSAYAGFIVTACAAPSTSGARRAPSIASLRRRRGGRRVLHARDPDRPDLGARAPGATGGRGIPGSPSRCCSASSTSRICCCAASPRAASARRDSPRSTASRACSRSRSTTSRSSCSAAPRIHPENLSAAASARAWAGRSRSASRPVSWPSRTCCCCASSSRRCAAGASGRDPRSGARDYGSPRTRSSRRAPVCTDRRGGARQ